MKISDLNHMLIYIRKLFTISVILLYFIILILLSQSIRLEAAPKKWSNRDYKTTTIENYYNHPNLKKIIEIQNIDYPALNAAIFYETNIRRKKHGLKILSHHPLLERAAFEHSRHMVKNNYFSHNNQVNGMDTATRIKNLKVINPYSTENIAINFILEYDSGKNVYTPGPGRFSYSPTGKPLLKARTYSGLARALLDQWMASPGHKKNILAKEALQLGCGAFVTKDSKFNDMPIVKATQDFQWYEKIKTK